MEMMVEWTEDFCADWQKVRLIAATDAGAFWLIGCLSLSADIEWKQEMDFLDGSKLDFDPWSKEDEEDTWGAQITMPPVMPTEFTPPPGECRDFDVAMGDLVILEPARLREIVSTMAGWSALVSLVGIESVPHAERVETMMMIETKVCHEYYPDGSAILWTPMRPRKGRVRIKT